MDLSCAFATSPATPEHVAVAESLGYRRAWCYDSPALYPDVWMVLALAAERTSTIGLGPAVLVPSLRHPMVNAAAIATLAGLAPGRVAVAVGAGFTGRHTMGLRAMTWKDVAEYVRVLRALLRGEEVVWDGAVARMLHPDGFAPARPIDVPILVGAEGPKGRAVATELGDGVFGVVVPPPDEPGLPPWRALLAFGTVLDEGEDPASPRVMAAAGHAVAVVYHGLYERGGAAAVDNLPGGVRWRETIEAVAPERRHLLIHEDHLVRITERDLPSVREAASLLTALTLSGTAAEVRDKVAALEAGGVTEIAYQPAGPDIPGELERFMVAASS